VTDPRIKGKGKGKEILYRYEGEVVDGEPDIFIRDPRKAYGFKAPKSQRPARNDFHELKYEVRFMFSVYFIFKRMILTWHAVRLKLDGATTSNVSADHQHIATDAQPADPSTLWHTWPNPIV
jgi:hypothetical protein